MNQIKIEKIIKIVNEKSISSDFFVVVHKNEIQNKKDYETEVIIK